MTKGLYSLRAAGQAKGKEGKGEETERGMVTGFKEKGSLILDPLCNAETLPQEKIFL